MVRPSCEWLRVWPLVTPQPAALVRPPRDSKRVSTLDHKGLGPSSQGPVTTLFALTKATMSGHFNVLREAGLVDADRRRTTITYRLQMSVLEDALLGFAESFGFELRLGAHTPLPDRIAKREA